MESGALQGTHLGRQVFMAVPLSVSVCVWVPLNDKPEMVFTGRFSCRMGTI